jgi:DUF1009 family protein
MADTLGIVAGKGEMPFLMAREARQKGLRVVTAALEGMADHDPAAYSDDHRFINIGKIGGIIKYLKAQGAGSVLFAGKVLKIRLYEGKVRPDLKAVGILMKMRDRRDDSFMDTIFAAFEDAGIKVADMREFCGSMLVSEGLMAGASPGKKEMKDVEFGFRMAKGVGALDIGQTVVVKEGNVMAVEAIEGTDEAILRGGRLSGPGAVVVKVLRPAQDPRCDLPAAGIETILAMAECKARVLALETGAGILINREKVASAAESAGISVLGFSTDTSL